MRTWLLGICVAGVLVIPGDAAACPPNPIPADPVTEQVTRFAKRVVGRALGSLVRKGMTLEEVRGVLRPLGGTSESGGVLGAFFFWRLEYFDYDLLVAFEGDEAIVLRVTKVV